MSSGNWSRSTFPYYRAGVNGALGETISKSWSGTNSPQVAKVRRSHTERRTITYPVNKAGKVVMHTQTLKFRVFDAPPARARVRPENPYTMSYSNYTIGTFYFGQTFSTFQAGYNGYAYAPTWSANDEIALMSRLRDAVAGSDFNAGVALAESREALKLIGDSARKIASALHEVRKGRFSKATRILTGERPSRAHALRQKAQTASQNWLELQYGWLPLLKDVEGAAQFAAHHHSTPVTKVVRVSLTNKNGTYGVVGPVLKPKTFAAYSRKTIIAKLTEKDVPGLLGLTDPLSIAWELTPYSFVADWFIPIGNYLSARALASSLTGTFVISQKTEATFKGMIMQPGRGSPSDDFCRSTVSFTRTVTNGLTVPLPVVKPLGQALSWKHATNSVALLVSSFRA